MCKYVRGIWFIVYVYVYVCKGDMVHSVCCMLCKGDMVHNVCCMLCKGVNVYCRVRTI